MPAETIIRTTCGFCFSGCGVLAHVAGNRVTRVRGDTQSPVNQGVLCPKGLSAVEQLYHPRRLRRPLQRTGPRGSGRWRELSWDQALDQAAEALQKIKDQSGAETVAFIQGAAKGLIDSYHERFANLFGSPNFATTGHVCFLPRLFAAKMTCGFYPVPDYEGSPRCILVWGAHLADTRYPEHLRTLQQIKKGAKLIQVDPLPTALSPHAEIQLRLRPGTDLALALAFLHVIIGENLYDRDFVSRWTLGFAELQTHVQAYPPEKATQITWVPAETIRTAARLFAQNKPAVIQWGNAIDHGPHSFQTARALTILRAITGNLDIFGGDLEPLYPVPGAGATEVTLRDHLPPEVWNKRVGAQRNLLPLFRRVLPQDLVKAVLQKDPYAVRAMYVHASNPLLTFGNSRHVLEALQKLDFLLVTDRFLTPTAALADMVLPAATYLEYDNIVAPSYYPIAQIQQKAVTLPECRSDFEIINGLAQRLGLGRYFFENLEAFFDLVLGPSGLTFREFREQAVLQGVRQERKYESKGFATPSAKVEIYAAGLKDLGFDPLPLYRDPLTTDSGRPEPDPYFPLVLTSQKSKFFRHSDSRQVQSLRDRHPEPFVLLHPDTARKAGIAEGDLVRIETARGSIKQTAKFSGEMDPRVIGVDFGWWFPESDEAGFFGCDEANINILTGDQPPFSPEMGSNFFRGLACRISKSEG